MLKKMIHGGETTKYRRFCKRRKVLIKLYMKEKGTCRNIRDSKREAKRKVAKAKGPGKSGMQSWTT